MGKIRSTLSEAVAQAFEVPAEAEACLVNWARWSAPRHGLKRRMNILATMAKRDRWGDIDADREAPAPFAAQADPESAWIAEKVLCNPVFWPPARALIQQHYLYRQDPRRTCRLLGIHREAYDHELWRAACMFWNRYKHAAVE